MFFLQGCSAGLLVPRPTRCQTLTLPQPLPPRPGTLPACHQDEDFGRAASLAFEMRQPGRLLAVLNKALERGPQESQVGGWVGGWVGAMLFLFWGA